VWFFNTLVGCLGHSGVEGFSHGVEMKDTVLSLFWPDFSVDSVTISRMKLR